MSTTARPERFPLGVGGLEQRWALLDVRLIVFLLVVAILAYLIVGPLVVLLWESFHPGWVFNRDVPFTLSAYASAYLAPDFLNLFTNTFTFALAATTLAVTIGTVLAWLVERTNLPLRTFVFSLTFAPLAIPGLVFAISYILMFSPSIGIINKLFMLLPFIDGPILNIYSLPGLILTEGIRLVPGAFLMAAAVLRGIDPALEEASYTSGTSVLKTARHVTLPLILPGVLAAFIYFLITAVESFDVPAAIAIPAKIHLFTTRIFFITSTASGLPEYGEAGAIATLFLVLSGVLIWLYATATRRASAFTTITGKGYRPRIIDLGRWKWVALAFVTLFFLFSIVFPFMVLVWASLLDFLQVPSLAALPKADLDGYRALFQNRELWLAVKNTFIMTLIVSTSTMLLASLSAWYVVRARIRGARIADALSFLPHAVPSIVIALAAAVFYLKFDEIPFYGTIWIIIVAMAAKRISYGSRIMTGAMFQLHKELEEAAEVSGVGWLRTFRDITLRLLLPAFVNGWLYAAMLSMALFSIPVMLFTPDSIVLSVLVWRFWENAQVSQATALSVLIVLMTLTMVFVGRWLAGRGQVKETAL